MLLKVSRLIVSIFWIFMLFQSIIVQGKNEYLYRSILDYRCEKFKELLVQVCDTSVG